MGSGSGNNIMTGPSLGSKGITVNASYGACSAAGK